MKNDREIMNSVRAAIDDCTRGIEEAPSLQYRIARKAKGEEPMAKKISGALALAVVMIVMLASVAFAVTNGFGILDFHAEQAENKAYTEKIISLNQAWEGEYFSATIHEAVFDGMKMSFAMSVVPKEGADPVFVIPRIKATADGKSLNTWLSHANGFFMDDGFWIPCMEPGVAYDYEKMIGVDVMLSDDMRTYSPVSEKIEWEITFDVLHPEWPIAYTQEDEPMIGEPAWTDAEYAVYDQQFADAYRAKRILLNRGAMLGPFASAIANGQGHSGEMPFVDWLEALLTQEAFTLKEQGVFRFATEPHTTKRAKEPVSFSTPDGLAVQLESLSVSVDEIGISLKIILPDAGKGTDLSYYREWQAAVLAENANTRFLGASCGETEDGSGELLYTAKWSIDGPTDRLLLVPIDDALKAEFYKNSGVISEEHRAGAISIELE